MFADQLKQIKSKSKILSCSSLRQKSDEKTIPDMLEIMNFLLPEIVNILLCDEVIGKGDCLHLDIRSIRYIMRLLASFTVVFDDTVMGILSTLNAPTSSFSSGVLEKLQNVRPDNVAEYISLFEWLGIVIQTYQIIILINLNYRNCHDWKVK